MVPPDAKKSVFVNNFRQETHTEQGMGSHKFLIQKKNCSSIPNKTKAPHVQGIEPLTSNLAVFDVHHFKNDHRRVDPSVRAAETPAFTNKTRIQHKVFAGYSCTY